jgi:hypothetical protein
MKRKSADDPIIYFTLIDFLLQLLFFGLFIFVVWSALGNDARVRLATWVFDEQYAPLINNDLSPFIRANEAKELSAVLNEIGKTPGLLDKLLNFLKQTADPISLLDFCAENRESCVSLIARCDKNPKSCEALSEMSDERFAALGAGTGKPFCEKGDGARALFTVVGVDTQTGGMLVIRDVTALGARVLEAEKIEIPLNESLTIARFKELVAPFNLKACIHVVRYRAESDSLKLSDPVYRSFSVVRQ